MNVSNLVHGIGHSHERAYPSSHSVEMAYAQTQERFAATGPALVANPYAQIPGSYHHSKTPQPPPSPPVEEAKCSLPSISSLFNSADGVSHPRPEHGHQQAEGLHALAASNSRPALGQTEERSQTRGMLPPTPPLRPDSGFEARHSPPTKVQYPSHPVPMHHGGDVIHHLDLTPQRQPSGSAGVKRGLVPAPSLSQESSPSPHSTGSYPAHTALSTCSDDSYQRPLPQMFPPSTASLQVSPTSSANPWQHHHYISPSAQASFPPCQDRYICPTCNKAFSRPSSLRIHSHSHTGEKPFRCPHQGCGKAFSVRSNMKRHERGCHSTSP